MGQNVPEVKRRALIKGSLGGIFAAVSTGAMSISAENISGQWDRDYDVVVIGSGTGLLAALVAAKGGKRVLVLAKSQILGGSTVVSGGVFWIPNNHVMKREGMSDSRENALTYLKKLSLGQAGEDLLTAFVDNGPEMVDYIESNTSVEVRVSKLMGTVADYHPQWEGALPMGRSLEPSQPGVGTAGGLLITGLLTAATDAGVEILASCPAKRLLTASGNSEQREVIGLVAELDGKPIRIRARSGVLVASGGFERNAEMKTHFLRGPSPYTLGCEANTGDGIHLGMDVGADLRNMNEVWGLTVYRQDADRNGASRGGISLSAQYERRNPGCIAVNRYGERFCNEGSDYDSTWRSYLTWENWGNLGYRNLPAFHIFDQTYRDRYSLAGASPESELPDWVLTAPTLAELADMIGIDRDGLLAQVERFNHYARQGKDPDFHRGESAYDRQGEPDISATLAPLDTGPFYGAEIAPADLGTCGGLRVNGKAQVMDVFGQPINRLFASGNTTGVGSPGALYGGGGGTLGPGLTFAFIAGKQLAASVPEDRGSSS